MGLSTQSLLEQFSRRTIATYDLLPHNGGTGDTAQGLIQWSGLRHNNVMKRVSYFALSAPCLDLSDGEGERERR